MQSPTKYKYESEVQLEADLNGDGRADHAAFLIDAKNNVVLWAFHQNADGFDCFEMAHNGRFRGAVSA